MRKAVCVLSSIVLLLCTLPAMADQTAEYSNGPYRYSVSNAWDLMTEEDGIQYFVSVKDAGQLILLMVVYEDIAGLRMLLSQQTEDRQYETVVNGILNGISQETPQLSWIQAASGSMTGRYYEIVFSEMNIGAFISMQDDDLIAVLICDPSVHSMEEIKEALFSVTDTMQRTQDAGAASDRKGSASPGEEMNWLSPDIEITTGSVGGFSFRIPAAWKKMMETDTVCTYRWENGDVLPGMFVAVAADISRYEGLISLLSRQELYEELAGGIAEGVAKSLTGSENGITSEIVLATYGATEGARLVCRMKDAAEFHGFVTVQDNLLFLIMMMDSTMAPEAEDQLIGQIAESLTR